MYELEAFSGKVSYVCAPAFSIFHDMFRARAHSFVGTANELIKNYDAKIVTKNIKVSFLPI